MGPETQKGIAVLGAAGLALYLLWSWAKGKEQELPLPKSNLTIELLEVQHHLDSSP